MQTNPTTICCELCGEAPATSWPARLLCASCLLKLRLPLRTYDDIEAEMHRLESLRGEFWNPLTPADQAGADAAGEALRWVLSMRPEKPSSTLLGE